MNQTSCTLVQTVLTTDTTLSVRERETFQRLIKGESDASFAIGNEKNLLITQKRAAELLSVSRSTIWRMTKDCVLHPVEILPGTMRYLYREISAVAEGTLSIK